MFILINNEYIINLSQVKDIDVRVEKEIQIIYNDCSYRTIIFNSKEDKTEAINTLLIRGNTYGRIPQP